MYKFVIITAIISIIIFTSIISLIILYYPFPVATSSRIEGYAGIIAVIITITIFLIERLVEIYKTKEESIKRKNNACNALLEELKDHKSAFSSIYPLDSFINIKGVRYVNRVLNTNAYDSISHTDLFTGFEQETQNKLSNLYNRIIHRNEILDYLHRYEDLFFLYTNSTHRKNSWIENKFRYEKDIVDEEIEIKDLMKKVEMLLKKEID